MNKTFFSGVLIVIIGGLTSYFITKISAVDNGFLLEQYFNNSILIFAVVIAALSLSSFFVSKISKK